MSKRVLIKWGIVPAVLLIIYFVTALSVGVNIVQAFIGIFAGAFFAALFLGWFWLLPLVPLSIAAAHSKSRWLYKFVPLSIPALSAAYLISRYDPEYLKSDIEDLLFFFAPSVFWASVPVLSLLAYIFFFYAITLDDITSHVRSESMETERISFGKFAIGWAMSVLAAIVVVIAVPTVKYNIMADTKHADSAVSEAQERLYDARMELLGSISEKYGDDIAKIGEFACRYGVVDWEYCQSEALEDSWRRVFEEGKCRPEIVIDNGEAEFWFTDYPLIYDPRSGKVDTEHTFFFLTGHSDNAYPVIYRAEEGRFIHPSENFERNGFIFFAGYYDGALSAGAVKTDGQTAEISCGMHIEYLDGKVWRRLGKTEHISGKTNDFGKFELTEDIALDRGHYRAVFTDDDLFAAAEFTVR